MSITAAQLVAEVTVTGADRAKSDLQGVSDSTDKVSGGFKSMLGNALSTAAGFAVFNLGAQAVGFLKDQFVDSIKVAEAHQQIMAQTNAVLQSTHDVSGMTAQGIDGISESLSRVTPFSQDAVQSTENLLLTFTNIGKNVMPQATQSVLDMSQALGQSTSSSAIMLGKALGDPLKGFTALQRVGVTFSAQEKDQIKTMMAHNDIAGAQGVILKELSTEFGGSAQAAGKTFAGALQIAKNNLEDLKIKIGTAVLPILTSLLTMISANVLPALAKFGDWFGKTIMPLLQQFGGYFNTNILPVVQQFGNVIKTALANIDVGSLLNFGKQAVTTFAQISPGVNLFQVLAAHAKELAQWFQTAVIPALKQAEPGFKNLLEGLQALAPVVKTVAEVIHNVLQAAFTAMLPIMEKAIPIIIQIAGILANVLGAALKFLAPYIAEAAKEFGSFVTGVIQRLAPIIIQWLNNMQTGLNQFLAVWKVVWPYLAPILKGVWDELMGIVKIAWALISGIINIGLDILSGNWKQAWVDLKTMLAGVWDGVKQIIHGGIEIIVGWLAAGWAVIRAGTESVWGGIKNFFSSVWSGIQSVFSGAISVAKGLVSGLSSDVSNLISSMSRNAVSSVTSMWSSITGAFSGAWGRISGALGGLLSSIAGWFGGLANQAGQWGAEMIQHLISGIESMAGGVTGAISNIVGSIGSMLHFSKPDVGPLKDIDQWMPDMGDLLATGIRNQAGKLQVAMTTMVKPMTGLTPTSSAAHVTFPSMQSQAPITVIVQPNDIILDGQRVSKKLMPHIANNIRYAVGTHGL